MLTGFFIFALVGILAVITHRGSRLEQKIVKNIPLTEWINLLVYPILLYLSWTILTRNIINRPTRQIFPMDDFDTLTFIILALVYGFVGSALHFTGKILWRYLYPYRNTRADKVNEMFHGKMSHYLVYLSALCVFFFMPLLELNHPLTEAFPQFYQTSTIFIGIIIGLVGSKTVFYTNEWFGGYNRPLFFISTALLSVLLSLQKLYALNYYLFPMNVFIVSFFVCFIGTFVFRQVLIFTHLNQKRRLRYISQFLNIASLPQIPLTSLPKRKIQEKETQTK